MSYYHAKIMNLPFDEVQPKIENELKKYGFGIVSEINMDQKFKEKLGVDFRRYRILGACSPKHAYTAVVAEEHIGLMLPCNIVMQERDDKQTEVSVVDPIASMKAVENNALGETAILIQQQLKKFLDNL